MLTRKAPMPLRGVQQLSVICSRSRPPAVLMTAMVLMDPAGKGMLFCR